MHLGNAKRVWTILSFVGTSCLLGCTNEQDYTASLEFDPETLAGRIDEIELSLVSTCFAQDQLGPEPLTPVRRAVLKRGEMLPGLGKVRNGQYGLYARGFGPCVAAAGCEMIEIEPQGDRLFPVLLREVRRSRYDAALPDNGGCAADRTCREQDGEAVCECPEGLMLNGTRCTLPGGTEETYLSDWVWLSEANGWGPIERDRSVNSWPHGDGNSIRLDGMVYAKGLGTNSRSELRVNLDARCETFRAIVGMDDEVTAGGNAEVEVWVDDTRVHYTPQVTVDSAPEEIEVALDGAYELRLVVGENGDYMNDHVDWANARVTCEEGWRGDAINSYASDWSWKSESNASGPVERDQSNGGVAKNDGTAIELDGTEYEKGIGVHGPSTIEIDLAGHCRRFRSDVGIDDSVTSGGSVVFEVWADDERVFESETMTSASPREGVNVDLVNRSTLRLVVTDGGDGSDGDLADWANARLLCRSGWTGERVETYVSDWAFLIAHNSYGPVERDMSIGGESSSDGGPLRMNGVSYARGIATNADSRIQLKLAGLCTRFRAVVGIDDSASPGVGQGDVRFRVRSEGGLLFESDIKHRGDPVDDVNVNVTGRQLLELEVDNLADDRAWDFGNWADARLSCEIGALGLP